MSEIVEPVDLCAAGRLAPEANGWSRRPLHRCNLTGCGKKRWDYWCVTDGKISLALCVADLGYVAGGIVSFIDFASGKVRERIAPWLPGLAMPETVDGALVEFSHLGVELSLGGGRLRARARGIEADLVLGPATESLCTVVPKSERVFHYTCKAVRAATGRITIGDRAIDLKDAFAGLDFGRGSWPTRTRWNWAMASGGRVSFNLGARWTDGTGATENGLVLDGKLHKIASDVKFADAGGGRASILGADVELQFEPAFRRRLGIGMGLDWRAGRFRGRILDQPIDDLFGWCEWVDILW